MDNTLKAFTTDEVAEILKVGRRTVYNYIKTGELKATRLGREYRVPAVELENFIQRGTSEDYYNKLIGKQE